MNCDTNDSEYKKEMEAVTLEVILTVIKVYENNKHVVDMAVITGM